MDELLAPLGQLLEPVGNLHTTRELPLLPCVLEAKRLADSTYSLVQLVRTGGHSPFSDLDAIDAPKRFFAVVIRLKGDSLVTRVRAPVVNVHFPDLDGDSSRERRTRPPLMMFTEVAKRLEQRDSHARFLISFRGQHGGYRRPRTFRRGLGG
jgi:hypothetical protein